MKLFGVLLLISLTAAVADGSAAGSTAAARWFVTPGSNGASCELGLHRPKIHPGTYVWCLTYKTARSPKSAVAVQMNAVAKLTTCHGSQCIGNNPDHDPTLKAGDSIVFGPFRCTALRAGVRCVVAKLGRGFLLSAHGVKYIVHG